MAYFKAGCFQKIWILAFLGIIWQKAEDANHSSYKSIITILIWSI